MSQSLADRILADLGRSGVRLGLDRQRLALAALGDPQGAFGSVLIAGTNGKGSTAAALAAMATSAGYRTGLYTSPHLEEARERIRVDGIAVEEAELGDELESVVAAAEEACGSKPTHFEALTAAAFGLFRAHGVELAVLEVGLGGRLDATNVVQPLLSVITDVGLDHREYLGETVTEIAREKAGVLRSGGVAVVRVEPEAARAEIRRRARELAAELHDVTDEVEIALGQGAGWDGQRLRLRTPAGDYELETALLGAHQAGNLAHAVRCAEELRELGWEGLDRAAITRGARRCRWPGRLERVALSQGRAVLLDVAHNAAAVRKLEAFLEERELRFDLLFGALEDKAAAGFLPGLAARASRVVLTEPPSPRAVAPGELVRVLAEPPAAVEREPAAALALALAEPREETLLVCGSIVLAGAVRRRLRELFGVPSAAAGPLY